MEDKPSRLGYEAEEIYSRIIKTPEGLDCLIVMKGWYWSVLDYWVKYEDWSVDDFSRLAWRCALEDQEAGIMRHHGDIKSEFQSSFTLLIYEAAERAIAKHDGHTNQNQRS